jgi:[protein-PII] uridylyltransferase
VLVDNDASAVATIVEVRAPDAVGLLYRITRTLADLGVDVRHAKVATLGHEAVDAFYVTEGDGTKLDPHRGAEVEQGILAALGAEEARQ